jgi:hypothetical protein
MFNAISKASHRCQTAVLGVFFFAAVMVLLPTSAQAQCSNWDASGSWYIVQGNPSFYIRLELDQKGRVLTGRTTQGKLDKNLERYEQTIGTVDGTIDGDKFYVQIFWTKGDTGVYNAKVLPSGRLDGEGYEKRSPNVRVPWHSEGVLKCAPLPPSAIPQSTPPRPKQTQSSGKAKKTEPAPPPPPMKVPGIVASQVIFEPPYPTGFVILTWDGGPDHPYAEVWVKVGEGDETFVVEQGKGERRVTVERNKTYLYILTDAGKTLSTDRVNVPPY